MKRKWKQILCGTLVGLLVATAAPAAFAGNGYVTEVEAASKKAKPKLNKTKISVKTGKTYTLKVNGTTRMPEMGIQQQKSCYGQQDRQSYCKEGWNSEDYGNDR